MFRRKLFLFFLIAASALGNSDIQKNFYLCLMSFGGSGDQFISKVGDFVWAQVHPIRDQKVYTTKFVGVVILEDDQILYSNSGIPIGYKLPPDEVIDHKVEATYSGKLGKNVLFIKDDLTGVFGGSLIDESGKSLMDIDFDVNNGVSYLVRKPALKRNLVLAQVIYISGNYAILDCYGYRVGTALDKIFPVGLPESEYGLLLDEETYLPGKAYQLFNELFKKSGKKLAPEDIEYIQKLSADVKQSKEAPTQQLNYRTQSHEESLSGSHPEISSQLEQYLLRQRSHTIQELVGKTPVEALKSVRGYFRGVLEILGSMRKERSFDDSHEHLKVYFEQYTQKLEDYLRSLNNSISKAGNRSSKPISEQNQMIAGHLASFFGDITEMIAALKAPNLQEVNYSYEKFLSERLDGVPESLKDALRKHGGDIDVLGKELREIDGELVEVTILIEVKNRVNLSTLFKQYESGFLPFLLSQIPYLERRVFIIEPVTSSAARALQARRYIIDAEIAD